MRELTPSQQVHSATEMDRLRSQLYHARSTILSLMPPKAQRLLSGYFSCQSRSEASEWKHSVVEDLLELAQPLTAGDGSYQISRAYCPLCGGGTTALYLQGFSLPEGLRRHLIGWGSGSRCDVTDAAFELAREYCDHKFGPAEEAEESAKAAELARRRGTETLYRVTPAGTPCLLEEGVYMGPVRAPEGLGWAEDRLKVLGFRVETADRIRSYTDERDSVIVFADPRQGGQLQFAVFAKPLPKRQGSGRRRNWLGSFHLLDGWHKGLKEKYEARLARWLPGKRSTAV